MGVKNGRDVPCEWCGKIIYKTDYQLNHHKHNFCSNECSASYRSATSQEIRECEICHKAFTVNRSSPQRFCSRDCQNLWQKDNTGVNNVRFRGQKVCCDWCHNKIIVGKAQLDRYEYHFCGNNCRQQWYSNVFSQSQEWKETSRIRGAELCAKQGGNYSTKPQIMVNQMLDDLSIKYINEKSFDFFSVDNYLQDYNLIIEVMGDYWHSNPVQYQRELNDMQIKRIHQDNRKHSYILQQYQINILYLWEYDIVNNAELCKELIALYTKNYGVLSNYHSFNYELNNSRLSIKPTIVNPYF